MKKLLYLALGILLLAGCGKVAEKAAEAGGTPAQSTTNPVVVGIENARTYPGTVTINVTVVPGITYSATIDNVAYTLGTPYSVVGTHLLKITQTETATGATSITTCNFTIDPNAILVVSGVLEGAVYSAGITITTLTIQGVTFSATLDGSPYIIGTPITSDGAHVVVITATSPGKPTATQTFHFTIDTTGPATPASFHAEAEDSKVELSWSNPTLDFAGVIIRRSTAAFPSESEGVEIYIGTNTVFTDTNVTNGTTYYYSIWAKDLLGNKSLKATASAKPAVAPVIPVGPASVNVPGDYATLKDALDAVATGGTIHVGMGDFGIHQATTINRTVTIIGAGWNKSFVSGGFYIDAPNVVIKGFTLTEGRAGVIVNGANATIMFNWILGNSSEISGISKGRGIVVNANGAVIKNNVIVGNSASWVGGSGMGIELNSVSNIKIENNTILSNEGYYGAPVGDGVGIKSNYSSAEIRNNIIGLHDCHDGQGYSTGFGIFAISSTLTIDYNDVFSNPLIPGNFGSGGEGAGNIAGADYVGCTKGAHDFSAYPIFSDGYFHLAANSPCKDAGDPASDFSHESNANGRIDIGAYGNADSTQFTVYRKSMKKRK